MDLEQAKEHFKDAIVVRCAFSGAEINIDPTIEGVGELHETKDHEGCIDIWVSVPHIEGTCCLYDCAGNKVAEIISKKTPTPMSKETYKECVERLIKEHKLDIAKLNDTYARSNNPYKVGDKIKDHYQFIEVDEIVVSRSIIIREYPECVYRGVLLKKDGTPRKDKSRGTVYQSNIEK